MLEEFLNINSYSDNYSVKDWNELIRIVFKKYILDESVFENNKEKLRTELINYCYFSGLKEYLELFENSIDYYNKLKDNSKSEFYRIFSYHFFDVSGTDMKWTNYALTQTDISKYSKLDQITIIFKAIEDILEGCFKDRFKLLYHVVNETDNIGYQDNLDFGQYISLFINKDNMFDLYVKDPIFGINISQWRNMAAHKTYEVQKENIKIQYGKKKVRKIEISHSQFERIFKWVKLSYCSLRLSQVITFLGNPIIYKSINENKAKPNLRFESWVLQLVHNLQIVGFSLIKTVHNDRVFNIQLRKRKDADINESVIHASQCLDQLSIAIYIDDFTRDKYETAKVTILSDDLEFLASAQTDIRDMYDLMNNKEQLKYKNKKIDLVKFKIGETFY